MGSSLSVLRSTMFVRSHGYKVDHVRFSVGVEDQKGLVFFGFTDSLQTSQTCILRYIFYNRGRDVFGRSCKLDTIDGGFVLVSNDEKKLLRLQGELFLCS